MISKIYLEKRKLLWLFSFIFICIIVISSITVISAVDVIISPDTPGGINGAVKSVENGCFR